MKALVVDGADKGQGGGCRIDWPYGYRGRYEPEMVMFVCKKGVEVDDGWTSRLFTCPVAVSEVDFQFLAG
jgi:hypothetical protein